MTEKMDSREIAAAVADAQGYHRGHPLARVLLHLYGIVQGKTGYCETCEDLTKQRDELIEMYQQLLANRDARIAELDAQEKADLAVMLDRDREIAELRRVLDAVNVAASAYCEIHGGEACEHVMEARRLLAGAGEVQPDDVSPPVKYRPDSDVIHAHDCKCWVCEDYREDMRREAHNDAT